MKLNNLIEGLLILKPHYEKGGDSYCIGAEHDQFFAYQTDTPLTDDEVTKMWELGWFQPETPDDEDENPGPYNPEDGWTAFT